MPVYSNVTGQPFGSAAEIPAMLARQLVEPVRADNAMYAGFGVLRFLSFFMREILRCKGIFQSTSQIQLLSSI
jgi:hypothetical protein